MNGLLSGLMGPPVPPYSLLPLVLLAARHTSAALAADWPLDHTFVMGPSPERTATPFPPVARCVTHVDEVGVDRFASRPFVLNAWGSSKIGLFARIPCFVLPSTVISDQSRSPPASGVWRRHSWRRTVTSSIPNGSTDNLGVAPE